AGNSQLGEKDVRLLPDASPGTYVQILVQDSGVGIPPQLLDRVFEPFFTTKEVGKGSGLGLSTVLGIVRAHGGFVNLQSQPGAGTQFYVYLPAQELTTLVTEDVPERAISRGMGETILIVDDEENVREVLRFTLEASGYRTLVACDGVEAVAIYRQHYQEVQLVLTDMAMPNLDGPSAIRQMKEINLLVEVIATSGVKTTGKLDEAMKAGAITFLPKPYTAERLLSVLEEILRRKPGK
ncbi:MAG: response regulator, partial [Blastocatellia bacterium]|nr:response regulator [Blastocatellia bacterium]